MAALPCIGRSASIIRLAANVWVLVFVSEVKAEVVDNISGVFHDVGALLEVASSSLAAENLKFSHVVDVGGGRKAGEDALAGKEERAGANGQNGSFTARVLLLQLGKIINETKRLGFFLENLLSIAAEDDEDVKVLEALMGLLKGDLRADNGALARHDLGLLTSNGDIEGLGSCTREQMSVGCRSAGPPRRAGTVSQDAGGWCLHSSLKS